MEPLRPAHASRLGWAGLRCGHARDSPTSRQAPEDGLQSVEGGGGTDVPIWGRRRGKKRKKTGPTPGDDDADRAIQGLVAPSEKAGPCPEWPTIRGLTQ